MPPIRRGAAPDEVLQDVSLTVRAGDFAAIVGPSGCGKSTLLNVIAGLQAPDRGQVLLDGDASVPRLGRVAYMHQRDLLLHWRTVLENARLGLELASDQTADASERVRALAGRFGLDRVLDARPAQLSGGMRQRVALMRAVLPDRGALLLDEPFGALDALTRAGLQQWLLQTLDRAGRAVLLVTHDVEEAILLAGRVHVMSGPPGRIATTVEVTLPVQRPREIVTSGEFVRLKRQVLDALSASQVEAP